MNKNTKYSVTAGMGLPITKNYRTLAGVSGQYIPFAGSGVGIRVDNTYPQILAKLQANSPTHGAALLKKGLLTFGQGINFDDMSPSLYDSLMNINNSFETINDVLSKISNDFVTYGGLALKISWRYDGTIDTIEHVPFKNVRLGRPVNGQVENYIVSNDWEMNLQRDLRHEYSIPKFNPSKINVDSVEIVNGEVTADEETTQNAEQLIYYKSYSVASDGFYPVPDYAQGLDSAFTEVEIGVSMLKSIENGIGGAYIVSTPDTITDDETKDAIVNSLNQLVTGAANSNGLIFVPSSIEISPLEAVKADIYKEVNPEIRQRIITSHGIPSILLEYSQGGGFNNRAEEYQVAIEQFQLTTIKGYQNQILRVLNSLMGYITNEDVKLTINPFLNTESEVTVEVTDESSLEA